MVLGRSSHFSRVMSWFIWVFGLQLGEAFGSLDILLSCILEALSAQHSIHFYVFQICTILYEVRDLLLINQI
jgi:hypothetical protein